MRAHQGASRLKRQAWINDPLGFGRAGFFLVVRQAPIGPGIDVVLLLPRIERLWSLLGRLARNRQIGGLGQDKRGVLAFCFPEPWQRLASMAETVVDLCRVDP